MVNTSDRPIYVDGVRLDTLGWNIEKINRATAGRRDGSSTVPGRDGVIPSLNDALEVPTFGLEMFVRGTDEDGAIPSGMTPRDEFWANLDELVHLFGKRHGLLEVWEQIGAGEYRTNLIGNPDMDATDGTFMEVDRNLHGNPRLFTDSTGWAAVAGTGGASTETRVANGGPDNMPYFRQTWTTAPTGGIIRTSPGATAPASHAAGDKVTLGGWVRSSQAQNITATIDWLNDAATYQAFSAQATAVAANTWTWITVTATAPANGTRTNPHFSVATALVGDTLDVTGVLVVRGNVPTGGWTYFDGATAAAGAYTYAWTGTAGASQSIRRAAKAWGTFVGANRVVHLSPNPTNAAEMALEVTGRSQAPGLAQNNTDTFVEVNQGLEGGNAAVLPGVTYTLSADVTFTNAATRSFAQALGFRIATSTNTPTPNYLPGYDRPLGKPAGTYRVAATFQVPLGASLSWIRLYNGGDEASGAGSVWWDHVVLERGVPSAPTYFDGDTTDATNRHTWAGTANQSASTRFPLSMRRAWAKVTDSIQPEMNQSGASGRFAVALELPYAVWEDVDAQTWVLGGPANGVAQTITPLTGATERITDAVLEVQGPATNPRLTDPATGAYVQWNGTLGNSAHRWIVNVGTWSTRVNTTGASIETGATDATGTDMVASTIYGGTPNQAAFLPLTPTRLNGSRVVRIALSGTAITGSTALRVRARRKFAL